MAKTKDHVENRDVMKDDFGWEVPTELVPLPTKGLIYDPESRLYNREALKIKAMTAREEDILSSQALLKEGTVLDHLIKSCLTDQGVDPSDMMMGDRNALMVAIRITGYGPEYNVETNCQKCAERNKVKIMLDQLHIKRLSINPVKEGANAFEFKLPVTKKTVIFKYGTQRDRREYVEREKNLKKHLEGMIEKNVTSNLEMSIVSIDGVTDRNKIRHFVMNMPAFDSKALRSYINDHEPGMDMRWSYTCSSCGHENDITMPMTPEFFWPST